MKKQLSNLKQELSGIIIPVKSVRNNIVIETKECGWVVTQKNHYGYISKSALDLYIAKNNIKL